MKFPVLKPSTKTITILAAVAMLLCISGVLTYMVTSGQLKASQSTLADKQKQVEDGEKIAKRIETARTNYVKAQAELCFLESSVSTYAYVPTLLGQLEQLGKEHNLKVISVRPQAAPPPPPVVRRSEESSSSDSGSSASTQADKKKEQPKPYEEIKITLELEGTYWCVHDFLMSLTRFPKIISVNELQASPVCTVALPKSPVLKVGLVVTAFVFKAEEGTQGAPAPVTMPPATNKAALINGRSSNEG